MCGFFKDLSLPSSRFNLHEFFKRYQFAIYHQPPNNYFRITFLFMSYNKQFQKESQILLFKSRKLHL